MLKHKISFDSASLQVIADLADAIKQLAKAVAGERPNGGIEFMFVVKDNNPDVNYSITAPSATDAEGNAIPDAQLTYAVTSTDDAVVAVTPGTDPKAGSVHFGAPGVATINVQVSSANTLLGSFAASFTVTTGDPAAIAGGSISFDGLTESPA